MSATFQGNVSLKTGLGVPGQLYADTPKRAQSYIINSANAAHNVLGATFCTITSEGMCQAGSGGTLGNAGFLIDPATLALNNLIANAILSPSLIVANETQVECLTMGTIVVTLPAAANIGDLVIYDNTTGALATIAPNASIPAGSSSANAFVDYYTVTAAGLAVITTNAGGGAVGSGTITGGGIAGQVTFFTGTSSIGGDTGLTYTSGVLKATNLTATNFIQPYAPLATHVSPPSAIDFFGDSITAGAGASTLANRWSSRLCAQLGVATENNLAVAGDEWQDAVSRVYAGVTNAPLKIIALGVNDLRLQDQLTEIKKCVESLALYLCLKSSGKAIDARSATIVSGTWVNNPLLSIGLKTTSNASISFSVTGRYIAMGLLVTCLPTTGPLQYLNSSGVQLSVTVNGNPIATNQEIVCSLKQTPNGATYGEQLYFLDTNSAPGVTQNVVVSYTNAGIGAYVDWYAGFDKNQAGCTPVVVPQVYDTSWLTSNVPQHYVDSLNNFFREVMFKFHNQLGLPIYFAANCGNYGTAGMLTSDNLHPNDYGHQYFANNMQQFLLVGAANYLAN